MTPGKRLENAAVTLAYMVIPGAVSAAALYLGFSFAAAFFLGAVMVSLQLATILVAVCILGERTGAF